MYVYETELTNIGIRELHLVSCDYKNEKLIILYLITDTKSLCKEDHYRKVKQKELNLQSVGSTLRCSCKRHVT